MEAHEVRITCRVVPLARTVTVTVAKEASLPEVHRILVRAVRAQFPRASAGARSVLCHDGRVLQLDRVATAQSSGLVDTPVVVLLESADEPKAPQRVVEGPGNERTDGPPAARPAEAPIDEERSPQEPESERACRFCFCGTEVDVLIAPCRCSGSVKYVHQSCLNEWRLRSANPESYHRCDQCQYVFNIEYSELAAWLKAPWVHRLVAYTSVLAAILLLSLALGGVEEHFYGLVKWRPSRIDNNRLVRALAGPTLDRLMAGVLGVSAVGFLFSLHTAVQAHGEHLVPWLCGMATTVAAGGWRILGVFAFFGCIHSIRVATAHVEARARVLLIQRGERVLAASAPLPRAGARS